MKKFLKLRYGQKGFTLIELLIVVAILGILAAVIIPNLSAFMTSGELAAANTEAENVKTASLAYYAEKGTWPANSGALTAYIAGAPKATYNFDSNYGWLHTVEPGFTWTGITWQDGLVGAAGNHGKWIKATP